MQRRKAPCDVEAASFSARPQYFAKATRYQHSGRSGASRNAEGNSPREALV